MLVFASMNMYVQESIHAYQGILDPDHDQLPTLQPSIATHSAFKACVIDANIKYATVSRYRLSPTFQASQTKDIPL
jgi:hypothetical protein